MKDVGSDQSDRPESAAEPAEQEWLTRKQVAERFGVSIFKVRSMEGRELHPVVRNGINFFTLVEINALPRELVAPRRRRGAGQTRRTEGEEASDVFKLFAAGKDLEQVVIEACVPPRRVRALYREWKISLEDGERIREHQERAAEARRTKKDEDRHWAEQEKAMRKMEKGIKAALRLK